MAIWLKMLKVLIFFLVYLQQVLLQKKFWTA